MPGAVPPWCRPHRTQVWAALDSEDLDVAIVSGPRDLVELITTGRHQHLDAVTRRRQDAADALRGDIDHGYVGHGGGALQHVERAPVRAEGQRSAVIMADAEPGRGCAAGDRYLAG